MQESGARATHTPGTSLRGPRHGKSDKAPAIITDGAKKWRRGTDGRLGPTESATVSLPLSPGTFKRVYQGTPMINRGYRGESRPSTQSRPNLFERTRDEAAIRTHIKYMYFIIYIFY